MSARASSVVTRSPSGRRSASRRSCGAATSRTRKAAGRSARSTCASPSRAWIPPRCRRWSAATPRGCTASISTRSHRSRRASARGSTTWPCRCPPPTSPQRRCGARPSRSPRQAASAKGAAMTRVRYGALTPEELSNREVKATSVGAWATSLVAVYETDPEVIAAVLPPPLEPTDRPLVSVKVATVDLGRGLPPFGAGSFAVQAQHEGTVGNYALLMPMTTEQSVVGGRETFGYPKKLAEVSLTRDGQEVHGLIARLGTTIIEITGRVTDPLDPVEGRRTDFYF